MVRLERSGSVRHAEHAWTTCTVRLSVLRLPESIIESSETRYFSTIVNNNVEWKLKLEEVYTWPRDLFSHWLRAAYIYNNKVGNHSNFQMWNSLRVKRFPHCRLREIQHDA